MVIYPATFGRPYLCQYNEVVNIDINEAEEGVPGMRQ